MVGDSVIIENALLTFVAGLLSLSSKVKPPMSKFAIFFACNYPFPDVN